MKHRSVLVGLALLLGVGLAPSPTHAQRGIDDLSDLGDALQTISEGYADNYVQPVTNTFGAGMNAGLFRSADVGNSLIPGFPLNVYVGVSVSGTLTSSMKTSFRPFGGGTKEFTVDGQRFTADYTRSGSVPTVFGETEPPGGTLQITNNQTGQVVTDAPAPQGLLDTPIAPLIVPQLSVGSVAGTDLQVRYFPKTTLSAGDGSYGKVGLFGLALRHDIDQWFPAPLPFNLAVQGAWNQFSLENELSNGGTKEVLDGSGWAFNLQASKGVPVIPLQFYGGLQYEKFSADYNYTLAGVGDISLSQTAANRFRGLAGFTLTFAVVRFNVDYAIGSENNVVTTGLGVRL
jgi:hypothetical protein